MLSTSTTHKQIRFGEHRLVQGLAVWYGLVWIATAIRPVPLAGA
jgi:hypothetical protein